MTVNEAIYRLLRVQFKKQLTEGELDIIKRAGFGIDKTNGHFTVYANKDNTYGNRHLYINEGYRDYRVIVWNGYREKVYSFKTYEDMLTKFDFEGFLRAPVNEAYRTVYYHEPYRTETRAKMGRLRDAKRTIKYRKDDIEHVKKQIADLQATLESAIRWEMEAEAKLKDTRREFGLVK